jgi:hypothetical protein
MFFSDKNVDSVLPPFDGRIKGPLESARSISRISALKGTGMREATLGGILIRGGVCFS